MSVVVFPAESQQLQAEGVELVQAAEALTITDTASFQMAGEIAKRLRVRLKRADEILDPFVESEYRTWKAGVAHRDAVKAPYRTAQGIIDAKLEKWDREQRQLRRDAEAAAQRERGRLEAEASARAEAERARLMAEAEEQRLAEALAAEAAGDRQTAERLIAEPIPEVVMLPPMPVFVPPVAVEIPKAEGVSFRERWEFEIVNAAQLPREYLTPDLKKIGGVVRALKGETRIPGVRVSLVRDVAAKAM